MRIHVLSDLHLEFGDFEPPQTDADVVVLAGDIHVGTKGVEWAKERFDSTPVMYVFGNHEYYGKAIPHLLIKAREAAKGTSVKILEQEGCSINGVRFLGCTFWTNFELLGDPKIAGYEATQKMTDYRRIRVSPEFRKLRSLDTAIMNRQSQLWLEREFAGLGEEKSVVITHHSPTSASLPKSYAQDLLSAAYASDLEGFVRKCGATVWIHGHIHRSTDIQLGNTRIVCNPRGYPDELVGDFVEDFIVEVDVHA